MNSRKFKILCNGQFIGLIFISDNNPNFPNCKVGTIWPFIRQGNWNTNDFEIVGQQQITDIFDTNTSDDDIIEILIARSSINRADCNNFSVVESN